MKSIVGKLPLKLLQSGMTSLDGKGNNAGEKLDCTADSGIREALERKQNK